MFDLRRPDAEPDVFLESGATLSHEGTVKSVVWVGEHTGVTAGEDGAIRFWPLAGAARGNGSDANVEMEQDDEPRSHGTSVHKAKRRRDEKSERERKHFKPY